MSDQPEALRLADALDEKWWRWQDSPTVELKAAAELRRQHEEIERMSNAAARGGHLAVALAEIEALKAERDALRAELREVTETMNDPAVNNIRTLPEAIRMLRAEREAYKRLAMAHSATMAEAHDARQRMNAEMVPVNALMVEINELHDKVNLLMDELSDMERASFSNKAVMRQALTALEGVVRAHSYESGIPVDAIATLRKRLGGV